MISGLFCLAAPLAFPSSPNTILEKPSYFLRFVSQYLVAQPEANLVISSIMLLLLSFMFSFQGASGGLERTRTSDLTLIRRAL